MGFLVCRLIEYSHVNILPQIAQITQRNAASCIITQRKTVCLRLLQLLLFCCFGFRLRSSAGSAGDILGFLLCILIEYSHVNILPQITQITLRNTAWLYYFAEKFIWNQCVFWGFGGCLRKSARSAGKYLGFFCVDRLSTLA